MAHQLGSGSPLTSPSLSCLNMNYFTSQVAVRLGENECNRKDNVLRNVG